METDAAGPGSAASIREQIGANLGPLYTYIARRARYFDAAGGVWADDNRAPEILDTVVADALVQAGERPAGVAVYRWLRGLADEAIDREYREVNRPAELSLDELVEDDGAGDREFNLTSDIAMTQPMLGADSDPNAALSPEETVVGAEFRDTLIASLRNLPIDLREPFLLHTRDGFTIEEVAKMEGTSVADARDRVAAAQRALRDAMADEYNDFDDLPATETMRAAIQDAPLDRATLERLLRQLSRD